MNSDNILDMIGQAKESYVWDAQRIRTPAAAKRAGRRLWMIAAVITLMLLLMGCGVLYVQGWFADFFTQNSSQPLSDSQLDLIQEKEQVIHAEQTQSDWTVTLRSTISDGTTAYIIFGVTAPEGVSLEETVKDGGVVSRFRPGNEGDNVLCPKGICVSVSGGWKEDGDGLENTRNYVLQLVTEFGESDPFAADGWWQIHIENIVREYDNEEYRQELLNGKYKGQTDVMFTNEETQKLICEEVVAEGTWDFPINFADSSEGKELLTEPVTAKAYVRRNAGEEIDDYTVTYEDVEITSFVQRCLTATVSYSCDGGVNFTDFQKDEHIYAVMKDGRRVEMEHDGSGGPGYAIFKSASPIVLEEADHILLADGTVIPVPSSE